MKGCVRFLSREQLLGNRTVETNVKVEKAIKFRHQNVLFCAEKHISLRMYSLVFLKNELHEADFCTDDKHTKKQNNLRPFSATARTEDFIIVCPLLH